MVHAVGKKKKKLVEWAQETVNLHSGAVDSVPR